MQRPRRVVQPRPFDEPCDSERRGDDFTSKIGVPNLYGLVQGEANAIAPGKRPLSSMSPTIVTKDGKPVMVVGTPGGSRIITTVLQIIMNVIDHGMNIAEASAAPRMHHQWLPQTVTLEEGAVKEDVSAALKAMGHDVKLQGRQGDAHSIWIGPDGTAYGANDKRSPDSKASVPSHLTQSTAGR